MRAYDIDAGVIYMIDPTSRPPFDTQVEKWAENLDDDDAPPEEPSPFVPLGCVVGIVLTIIMLFVICVRGLPNID